MSGGDIGMGGFCPGGFCPGGGYCPGNIVRGGYCPRTVQSACDISIVLTSKYRICPIKRTVQVEVGKSFCRRDVGNLPFYRTPQ